MLYSNNYCLLFLDAGNIANYFGKKSLLKKVYYVLTPLFTEAETNRVSAVSNTER